jgi:flagellar biosynthesis protein FliQ
MEHRNIIDINENRREKILRLLRPVMLVGIVVGLGKNPVVFDS